MNSVPRVALVNPPWADIDRPSVALGLLKRVLRREGIPTDVYYLNIRLARMLGFIPYTALGRTYLFAEWLFSQHLFGEYGTGEVKTTSADVARDCLSFSSLGEDTIEKMFKSRDIDVDRISREVLPRFIEECMSEVPWEAYSVVGFTSVFSQQVASLLLAKKIKERYPQTSIVIGGSNVEGVMGEATLEAFDWIDYIVNGEGEPALPALVKNILSGNPYAKVPGVSFREGQSVVISRGSQPFHNMDESPIPDYVDYFRELKSCGFGHVGGLLLFESSRGCWWGEKAHCTFCGLNGGSMKYRTKSAQRVAAEVVTQSRRYNSLHFEAVDNIIDTGSFTTLLPELSSKNMDFQMFYEVKSSLNKDQVMALKSAGVGKVQPGIESLNTEVLKLMRKGVTAIQNIQLLKFCRELGIGVEWNLLYGFPGEKREHYEQILESIPFITHLHPPSGPSRIVLQRFSPNFFDAERLGIRNVRPAKAYSQIYPEGRADLGRLAFYFDHTLDDSQEDPSAYIKPVNRAAKRWARSYLEGGASLKYRRGPGFVEIVDTRTLGFEENGEGVRRTILKGVEAEMYLYCDSIRGLRDLQGHVSEKTSGRWTASRLQELLDRLIEGRLMFREKDRFLSLATAERPSPSNYPRG